MSCYSCSTEFGFLRKEVGCEVCGFSFCPKCCKKQQVPSENGESKKIVCNKCIKELTSDEPAAASKVSPPLAHKKRMAALKKQSFSIDSSAHIRLKSQCSNETDKDLAERLQRLKRDRMKADSPSESEIEERLARLKGMDPARYKAPPIQVFRPTEKVTAEEQASNLITQITEEVALDSRRVKPEDEIAARLAKLRDEPGPPPKTEEFNIPSSIAPEGIEHMPVDEYSMMYDESRKLSEAACKEVKLLNTDAEYRKLLLSKKKKKETISDDDEEEADKLVEQLLATQLDDADMEEMDSLNDVDTEKSNSKSTKENMDEEELPWCVICTEDAKIRCFGCEGDLYCLRCFKECHDSLDIKDHKTCPFLPPKVPVM